MIQKMFQQEKLLFEAIFNPIHKLQPKNILQTPQYFMLILYQTVLLVVLLITKDTLSKYLKHSINESLKSIGLFFSHLKRWEQSLRLVQFALIFLASQYQASALYIRDHAGLMMVGKAKRLDTLSNIMSSNRKLLRLVRLPEFYRDLNELYRKAKFQKQKPSFKLLVVIQFVMAYLSDFFNLLYNFTDHFTLMFLFGIFTNKDYEYEADYWGNVFWIISNVFLAIKDIITIYILKSKNVNSQKKLIFFVVCDFLRNILDSVIAYTFFNQSLVSKRDVGLMGVTSSVIMLADFWK